MTVVSYSYCVKMMQYPVLNKVLTEMHTQFAFIGDEDVGYYTDVPGAEVLYDYDEDSGECPAPKHAYVFRDSLSIGVKDAVPAPTMDELCIAFSMLHARGYGGRLDLSFDDERGDFAIFTPRDKGRFKLESFKLNFPKSAYVEDYLAIALIAVAEEMNEEEP